MRQKLQVWNSGLKFSVPVFGGIASDNETVWLNFETTLHDMNDPHTRKKKGPWQTQRLETPRRAERTEKEFARPPVRSKEGASIFAGR